MATACAVVMAGAGLARGQQTVGLGSLTATGSGISVDLTGAFGPGVFSSYEVTTDWSAGLGNPWSNEAMWSLTDRPAFAGGSVVSYADPGASGDARASGESVRLGWSGRFARRSVEDGSWRGQLYRGGDSLVFNAVQAFAGSEALWTNTTVTLGRADDTAVWTEGFASGTTAGGRRWERPIEAGLVFDDELVRYDTAEFEVSDDGSYDLASLTPGFDGYLYLYEGGFDASSPLAGLIAGDDDGPVLGIGSSVIEGVRLIPGTVYVAVVTGFEAGQAGAYSLNLLGPGSAVPAPGSLAVLGLGGVLATRRRRR